MFTVGATVALLTAVAMPAGATTGSGSAVLGTPNVARGSVVTIGFMTDGESGSVNDISEVPAAKAAAQYVNHYLDGVGGHVLALDICDNNGTPAGTTDCANQFVADKVAVGMFNVSANGAKFYAGLSAGNVPMVSFLSADTGTLSGKLAYGLTNALSTWGGPAVVAKKVGAKHPALILLAVPVVLGTASSLAPKIYAHVGISDQDIVAIPPGTPDMTPQVQAALSKGADFINIIGDSGFCTTALKAIRSLDFKGTTTMTSSCIGSGTSTAIPNGYSGYKAITSEVNNFSSDSDVKVYKAAMAKYEPATNPYTVGNTPGAFGVVTSFARAMKGLSGAPTSANIEKAFAAMPPTPLFFGHGATFQCNGKQVGVAPGLCSSGAVEETLNQAGNPVSITSLNTSQVLK